MNAIWKRITTCTLVLLIISSSRPMPSQAESKDIQRNMGLAFFGAGVAVFTVGYVLDDEDFPVEPCPGGGCKARFDKANSLYIAGAVLAGVGIGSLIISGAHKDQQEERGAALESKQDTLKGQTQDHDSVQLSLGADPTTLGVRLLARF